MADKIADSLDMVPLEKNFEDNTSLIRVDTNDQSQIKNDFEYARGNMIATIEKSREALDGMLEVAQMSQHPRSYEVVSDLIKTMSEINKDLLELSKKKKELELEDDKGPKTINNNLFVGSTSELQKLIKQQNEQK